LDRESGLTEFRGTDRFEVKGLLGAGGMGRVYRAFDRERRAEVALKTLSTLSADALARFKKEFRVLQDLRHPNLVALHELISEGGQWFFTMELVDGVDVFSYVRFGRRSPLVGAHTARVPADAPTVAASVPTTPFERRTRQDRPHVGHDQPPSGEERAPLDEGPLAAWSGVDEARLRAVLGQLARGLHVLHRAHKVHRDIKPSNVLVTDDGRLVLLDFGLAIETAGDRAWTEISVVGTIDYMAPEQAALGPVGPEADWYAVGVVLYEILTGRLPFSGSPFEVMQAKQRQRPASPRELLPEVPEVWDALCLALLSRDARDRPQAQDVLRRLGIDEDANPAWLPVATSGAAPASPVSAAPVAPFVGRRGELAALADAFDETRHGRAVSVLVGGESGVGKTQLVREFTDGLARSEPQLVVLAGRCFERESVPYKALDGVVDAVCHFMQRLPRTEAAALLPLGAALLAQTFPVLRLVEAIASAPLPKRDIVDPKELRRRVFAALRELLERLAERRPLIVAIDDLQWADADSLALLGELLRPPDPPPLMLVATVRSGAGVDAAALAAAIPGAVRRIELGPLPPDEARELAALLLGAVERPERAQAIVDEAVGHPLFIDELVRHALARVRADERAAAGPVRLDEALWSRIAALDGPSSQVLELVAVAGSPLPQEVASRASALEFSAFDRSVALLGTAHLARTTGAPSPTFAGVAIEPYHDRVRDTVLAHLPPPERRDRHRLLSQAYLATGRTDPETLLVHSRGGGDFAQAARYAARAAAQAAEALAFDRAARLYRLALELAPQAAAGGAADEMPPERELRIRLGEALANGGRGGEAAREFLAAATGASPDEALDLRRRAAEQLLVSGHLDEGLDTVRQVLGAVGMALPASARSAVGSLLLRRAQLRLRGLGFRERKPDEIPVRDLMRIDASWSVAVGLSTIDTLRGAVFQTRSLLLALDAGDPHRIARALAFEAAFVATGGGPTHARTTRLLTLAEEIAGRIGDPHAVGWAQLARGFVGFLEGRWKECNERFQAAEAIFRGSCTGVAWELDSAELFSLWSLFYLGELDTLARTVPERVREARERGDLYAETNLRARAGHLQRLVADDAEAAEREGREAIDRWSRQGTHAPHYYAAYAEAEVALYRGGADAAEAAHRRLLAFWPTLDESLLLRVQFIRIEALHLRARTALAAAASATGSGVADRSALLRAAEADARRIEREAMPWSDPLAALLRAALSSARGDREGAIGRLEAAARGCDATDMALYAHAARRRQGELLGGDAGRALVDAADAWLRARGVACPDRLVAALAPGFSV
jgi:serine/threonine protein kinase